MAILSSTPYFYFTKKIDHQCSFDRNFQLFVTICFHISATFFFVLPAFILCLLYALMAQRLYNIGLLDEVHWSKNEGIDLRPLPMDLQNIKLDDHILEEKFRATRHLSSSTLIVTRQLLSRSGNIPSPGLSLHIQSMKKSVFKMLCKFINLYINM
jgi:hypothetical protein